jgi:hypothetical protein
MSAAPFSGSVIVLRENRDGIFLEVFHWDNLPEGVPVPPRGPITGILAGGTAYSPIGGAAPPADLHDERMAVTRTETIAKFTSYINAKFPDTTA